MPTDLEPVISCFPHVLSARLFCHRLVAHLRDNHADDYNFITVDDLFDTVMESTLNASPSDREPGQWEKDPISDELIYCPEVPRAICVALLELGIFCGFAFYETDTRPPIEAKSWRDAFEQVLHDVYFECKRLYGLTRRELFSTKAVRRAFFQYDTYVTYVGLG